VEIIMLKTFLRFPAHLLAVAALVLFAAPALAGTMAYSELLTSDQSWFGADLQFTHETSNIGGDPLDILLDGNVTAGAGIGDGFVSGYNDLVQYTHSFSPASGVASVNSAELIVFLRDDGFDLREQAKIELNDSFWTEGEVNFISLFGDDVTAAFLSKGDELTVAIIGKGGDFIVDSSYLRWTYESDDVSGGGATAPGGASPVPEPTGLALFCVGAVVIRRATRRQD